MDSKELKQHIGLKIKSYRLDKKLSQEEFCSIINLEQPNLSKIETGKSFPDIETLCNIFKYTDIEPNFLFKNFKTNYSTSSNIDWEIFSKMIELSQDAKLVLKKLVDLL